MNRYPEKKKQNKTNQNKKAAVQHLVHVNGHWLPKFGGGGGVWVWKRKKEKRGKKRQREVEKKVIWRLLRGGDKHNEKSKIK
jgi:hypothetical protein